MHETNNPGFIYKKTETPGNAVSLMVHPVFFGDFTEPVAEQVERQPQFLPVLLERGVGIDAYSENNGIVLFQGGETLLVLAEFSGSDRGKGQGEKDQRHVFLSPEIGKAYVHLVLILEREIRCGFSDGDGFQPLRVRGSCARRLTGKNG